MNSQSIIPDFWEKPPTQPTKTQSQLSHAYGSLPQRQTLDSSHPPHHTQKSKSRQCQVSGSESRPENYTQKSKSRQQIFGYDARQPHRTQTSEARSRLQHSGGSKIFSPVRAFKFPKHKRV